MKKIVRILTITMLLGQYLSPIVTMAEDSGDNTTIEQKEATSETQQIEQEEAASETQQTEQTLPEKTSVMKEDSIVDEQETVGQTQEGNQEEANAPPLNRVVRAVGDSPIVLPDGVGTVEIDKDNFLEYFKLNGSAAYDANTGILTLTPDENSKAGNATFKNKILFTKDFTMDLEANIGDKSGSNGGADGIGIGFHSGNVNSIGDKGNGFGVKGLPNVLGYKIDTYKNSNDGDDIAGFGNNETFVSFMGRNGYQTINDVNKYGESSRPQKVGNPENNQFKPLLLNYNTGTSIYTAQYDGTRISIDPKLYYNSSNFSRSLIMSASTGAQKNLQQIKINKITLSVPVAVIEKVDASNPDIKLQGATFDIFNSNNVKVATDLKTDSNGYIYLPSNLESGNYYAVEKVAPSGYELNKDAVSFTIDANKETSYIAASIKNFPKPGILQTSKEVNKKIVRLGDTVTYTINVNNIGELDTVLNNVKVEDLIPDGITLDSNSIKIDGSPTQNESQSTSDLLLTLSKIAGGQGKKITFNAVVTKSPEAIVNNVATITDPNHPNDPQKPEVPIKVVYSAGKLDTEKAVYDSTGKQIDNQQVKVGDVIEYRVTAKNKSGTETIVNNVTVSDAIPSGLSYEAGSLKVTYPDGTTKALSDDQVKGQDVKTENLGSVTGGQSVVVSFKVKVTETATGTIKNVAVVEGTTPPVNPEDPEKPIDPETPEVPIGVPGEVTGEKLVNGGSEAKAYVGDTLEYTIKLTHKAGTGQWSGNIIDALPEHLSYVPGSTSYNGSSQEDNAVWKDGVLTVQNVVLNEKVPTATVTFKAKVEKEALNTTVKNKAQAQPTDPKDPTKPADPTDPNSPKEPEIPEVPTEVIPSTGELEGTKAVYDSTGKQIDNQQVKVGDVIEYRVTAKNKSGTETIVNNVTVSDAIPSVLSYEAGSLKVTYPDGTTKALSDDQVKGQDVKTENLGSVTGGQSVVVSFKVKVTETATGTIKNVAVVEGTTPPVNPEDPEKPIDPETPEVPIGVPGEVTGEKLVNGGSEAKAYVGDTLEYTIKLTHKAGTGQWSGNIIDALPEHLSYVPGSTSYNGSSQEDNAVWKDGVLTVQNVVLNEKVPTATVTFKAKVEKEALNTTVKNKAQAQPTDPKDPTKPADPTDPNSPKEPEIPEVPTEVIPSTGELEGTKAVYDSTGKQIDNQQVKVGDVIEYRVTAKNKSGTETIVNNVTVSDAIPSGLSYEAGSLKVTYPDGTTKALPDDQVKGQDVKTENLGSVTGGQSVVVSFKVKVTETATGTIKNVAVVEGTTPPVNPEDPEKPIDPETPEVPIGVPGEVTGEKLVNGGSEAKAYVGDTLEYTIKLTHKAGTGQWSGNIIDALPEHLSYVPGSTSYNGSSQEDNAVWKDGVLTVQNVVLNEKVPTATVTFKAKVEKEALNTTVKNKAQAQPTDPKDPTKPADPTDPNSPKEPEIPEVPTEVIPSTGELEGTKAVYDSTGKQIDNQQVKVGDVIEYRVTAKNKSGTETIVNNVTVSDAIPSGLSYEAGSLKVTYPDGTTKALPDDQVKGQDVKTENLGSVTGGQSVVVSFKVKVTETATGTIKNVAVVEGTTPPVNPEDPEKPIDPETPEVPIGVPGEVTGEKLVNGGSEAKAYVGDTLEYTIKLTHKAGTGQWSGNIIDALPEHLSYVPGSTSYNGSSQEDNAVWKDGVLTVQNVVLNEKVPTATVTFKAKVEKEALNTTVKNKAQAQPTDPKDPTKPADPTDPNSPKEPEIPEVPTEVIPSTGELEGTKAVYDSTGKQIDNQQVKVWDVIEYRVTAKNKSGTETIVNNVTVSDAIPSGLSYEAGSLKVTYPDGTTKALSDDQVKGQDVKTENLGSVTGGQSVVVSFKVKVTETATGTIKNVAVVEGTTPPVNPEDPEKPIDPETPEVPIGVPGEVTGEKLVNGGSEAKAYVGDTLEYTIKLTHKAGTGQWSGNIIDALPEHLSYVPGSTSYNGSSQEDNAVWKDGVLTVQNVVLNEKVPTATVTFKAKVEKEALNTTVKNKAQAQPTDPKDPTKPADPTDPNSPKEPEIPEVPTEVIPSTGELEGTKAVYDSTGKQIDNQQVKVGDVIEYRVTAKNKSGTETIVNNVTVSDAIPSGLSYEAGSLKVTYPDGTTKALPDDQVKGQDVKTENLGSVTGGQSVVVSFKVKVTETATGTIKNVAVVEGTTPPVNPEDPEKPIDPETPEVPIGVPGEVTGEKLVNGGSEAKAYVGDTLEYTIKLTHKAGTGQWSGNIIDALPEHLSYVPGSTSYNGSSQEDNAVWKDGVLTVQNVVLNEKVPTATVTFKAKVEKEALNTTVKNKAQAQPTDPKDPTKPADPTDPNSPKEPEIPEVPTEVIPSTGELEGTKAVYDSTGKQIDNQQVKVGDVIEYRVTAKNKSGTETIVNNVTVSDAIPSGLSYEAGSLKVTYPDGTTKALPDDQVKGQDVKTENLGSVTGGQSVVVSFKVKVTETATGTIKNVAVVEGTTPPVNPEDPEKPIDPETPEVPIGVPGEVTGEKLVNGGSEAKAYVGDTLEYTIKLTHKAGTGQWSGNIIDALPEHLSYVPGSTSYNGSSQEDNAVWKDGVLTVQNVVLNEKVPTATVTFKAKVEKEALNTTVKNKAQAQPTDPKDPTKPADPTDPNSPKEPEIPEVPTEVIPSTGELEGTKAVYDSTGKQIDNQQVKVGDVIEYRVTAKNKSGTETIVNNVTVSDAIPSGLSYEAGSLKVTYPDGTTKALSDDQVKGQDVKTENLGSVTGGQSVVVSFKVKVTETATGTIKNVAIIKGTVPGEKPGDPDKPINPENPEVPITVVPEKPLKPNNPRVTKNIPTKGQLLNTGEAVSYLLPLAGAGIILSVLGYKLKRKRSK